MTSKIHAGVALLASFVACNHSGNQGGGGGASVAWKLTDRGLTYKSVNTSGFKVPSGQTTTTSTFAIALAAGTASVTRDGAAIGKFAIVPSGALSPLKAGDPAAPPELDILAIYEDAAKAPAAQVGTTWSRVDPSDAEVAAHQNNLVVQSKRDFKVTKLNGDGTAEIEVNGSFRFVDTPGGRAMLKKLLPTADKPGTGTGGGTLLDSMLVLTAWSPYMAGSAVFDTRKGELARYSGTMLLDYNPSLDATSIRASDARIEVTLERQ